ncbi:MAG TPA: AsmA-like C-terminal region-containing protein [Puia sp.]|nr:AsmA-like C-terminal region-containing protein [Puia sp.]
MKKTLKITGIVLLILLGVAFAIPLLFKGKITNLIKTQVNKSLTAKVDFSDVDLSLFRNFPRLAVRLDSLRVTGTGEFAEDTLVSARQINVAVNLLSVISGDVIKIHSIKVDQARVHAIVHKNGHNNWSITIPDTAAQTGAPAAAKPFKMELQEYALTDAYISYRDDSSHMSSEISGLNHSGSGDFTSDLFTLETKTQTQSLTFTYGGIPYLLRAQTNVVVNFQVDNKAAKYAFKVDDLSVNDLKLNTEGFIQAVNDSAYNMDIKFNAPSNDFKSILSMIPAIYQKDFASIKTSGEASFSGSVKGLYDSRHLPAYHVNLAVKNGQFQYPDLPKPVQHINITLAIDNPDGVTDHTVVNLSQGHLEMDQTPFDFRLLLKTPVSDPYIDAAAKGNLDLAKVTELVKLENGTHMTGAMQVDLSARGNYSAIEKQQYDRFAAAGSLGLSDFLYASNAYPGGIRLNALQMSFTPKNITISQLLGDYLKTSFNADGTINNLLGYMLKHQDLDGSLRVKADQINLNDWMASLGADSTAGKTAGSSGGGTAGNGGTAASAPFVVPSGIRFVLNVAVDKLHYDNLDMQNASGSVQIAGEVVKLNNIRFEALDGVLTMNGAYSSHDNPKKPVFSFDYDVKGLDIQKTFFAFNTVQKLMPAGKFVDGKLSSQLTLNGQMAENGSADVNSLNGGGSLLVAQGMVKNLEPLDKLAQSLNLNQLKNMELKDISLSFTFKNGKVIVNPFTTKVNTIDMKIGGAHGFDQSLDYAIRMKVPRALLGDQANGLVNNAVAQVGAKGIPLKVGETVDLNVKMGGTLTNPLVTTDLKDALAATANGVKQQVVDLVQARVDSAKQQLKDTARVLKQQLISDAGAELKKQLAGKGDTTATAAGGLDDSKKKVTEAGKGLLNGLLKKKKN